MLPLSLLATSAITRNPVAPLLCYASSRNLRLKVKKRDNTAKNYEIYNRFDHLKLAEQDGLPQKWKISEKGLSKVNINPERERNLLPISDDLNVPYQRYNDEEIAQHQSHPDYFDPLFKPDIIKDYVNPQEEPFKSIYADSQPQSEFTKVKNITTPELWSYVERLARRRTASKPTFRPDCDPIKPTPSGYIAPPESPPDLPYFVARTRNYVLPVYYHLDNNPDESYTMVCRITGDLWQFERDLRTHLEAEVGDNHRILTSVREPFGKVSFRGKYIQQVAAWLHEKGF